MLEEGIAWRIVDLQLELPAGDATDEIVAYAGERLEAVGRSTSASELRKALAALSKLPQADTIKAVRSALGAMETTARDITGERNATLGPILKKHREGGNILPATLLIPQTSICSPRRDRKDGSLRFARPWLVVGPGQGPFVRRTARVKVPRFARMREQRERDV